MMIGRFDSNFRRMCYHFLPDTALGPRVTCSDRPLNNHDVCKEGLTRTRGSTFPTSKALHTAQPTHSIRLDQEHHYSQRVGPGGCFQ
jgi:hypothetical protein